MYQKVYTIPGFPDSSAGKESTCNARDPDLTSGSGRSAGEGIGYPSQYSWWLSYASQASLVAQLVKICLQCGRPGFDPWVGKIPWRRECLSTPGILTWRSPWGCSCKESDTAERLSFSHFLHYIGFTHTCKLWQVS